MPESLRPANFDKLNSIDVNTQDPDEMKLLLNKPNLPFN